MSNEADIFRALGASMQFSERGVNDVDASRIIKGANTLFDPNEKNYEKFHRNIAKMGSRLFVLAGEEDDFLCTAFDKLANCKEWHPYFSNFTDHILCSLGENYMEEEKKASFDRNEALVKQAVGPRAVANTLAAGFGLAKGGYKSLLGLAALLGATGGTGYWWLNRAFNENDNDALALKEKIKSYKRITNRIRDRLKVSPEGAIVKREDNEDSSYEVPIKATDNLY